MDTRPQLHIAPDPARLAEEAAHRVVDLGARAIDARGRFHLALAGGNTPRRLYGYLSDPAIGGRLDWSRVEVYFGDERCVAPDHPDSNYRMARESLLDQLAVPGRQVHAMPAELSRLWAGVGAYAALLAGLPCKVGGYPILDLVLLGLGADGHTASLFPRTCILHDHRAVAAVYVPRLRAWRMSLTLDTLNAARHVLFLTSGADKAHVARRVLAGEPLPAAQVRPDPGSLEWYLDRAAAARLD